MAEATLENFRDIRMPNANWGRFKRNIKYKNRFFSTVDQVNQSIDDLLDKNTINLGKTILYRARCITPDMYSQLNVESQGTKIRGLPKSDSAAPPEGKASAGRANPKGISYLYLASKVEVACAEVRPTVFELISVKRYAKDFRFDIH